MYQLDFHKKTIADKQYLNACGLLPKVQKLCDSLSFDPVPLNSKKLSGDLEGKRSVRINLQHRIVYEILEEKKIVRILRLWGHYEGL